MKREKKFGMIKFIGGGYIRKRLKRLSFASPFYGVIGRERLSVELTDGKVYGMPYAWLHTTSLSTDGYARAKIHFH